MEQITSVNNGRRNTIFAQEQLLGGDQSHAKTELVLMHRKCERLMQKERRMVVRISCLPLILFHCLFFSYFMFKAACLTALAIMYTAGVRKGQSGRCSTPTLYRNKDIT